MTSPDSGEREVTEMKLAAYCDTCGVALCEEEIHCDSCGDDMREDEVSQDGTRDDVRLPPDLAQRILAALEDIDTQEVRAIRAELRAVVERKP